MSLTSYTPTKRLAIILPSTNTTVEPLTTQILLPLLATSTISLHYTRLRLPKTHPPSLQSILDAASAVTDLNPDYILYTNSLSLSTTSSSNDQALVKSIESTTRTPCTTLPLAFLSALQYLNLTRVALVTPYSAGTTGRISDFFQGNNITVVKIIRLNPPPETEQEIAETDKEDIEDLVFAAADHEAVQAVLVVSEALLAAGTVELLERETGKVVLEGVGVGLWSGLRGVGWKGGVRGWGRLLASIEMAEERTTSIKNKRSSKDVAKVKDLVKPKSGQNSPQVKDRSQGFAIRDANARREAGVLTAMREANGTANEPATREVGPVKETVGRGAIPVRGNAFSEANARKGLNPASQAIEDRPGTPLYNDMMRQEAAARRGPPTQQEPAIGQGPANGVPAQVREASSPRPAMAGGQDMAPQLPPIGTQEGSMSPRPQHTVPLEGAIQPELFMQSDGRLSPHLHHETPTRPEPPLTVSPFAANRAEASPQTSSYPHHGPQNGTSSPTPSSPYTFNRPQAPEASPHSPRPAAPPSEISPYTARSNEPPSSPYQNGTGTISPPPASPLYPSSPYGPESPMLSHPATRPENAMRAFRHEFANRTARQAQTQGQTQQEQPRDWSGVRPSGGGNAPQTLESTPERPVGPMSTRPVSHQRIPVVPVRQYSREMNGGGVPNGNGMPNGGMGMSMGNGMPNGDGQRALRGSGRGMMDGRTPSGGAPPAKRMSIGVAE
ncbi:hypothetical protein MBLNU457_6102t2 [Dothideomycetes sp. NU457]